jgi:hypothetical protein
MPHRQHEDLSEATFSTTAFAFERIPTWRQVLSTQEGVAMFRLRRWATQPLYLESFDDRQRDPPDPKLLAFLSGIDFEDLLSRLARIG